MTQDDAARDNVRLFALDYTLSVVRPLLDERDGGRLRIRAIWEAVGTELLVVLDATNIKMYRILVGRRGRTHDSIETLVSNAVNARVEHRVHVVVRINPTGTARAALSR